MMVERDLLSMSARCNQSVTAQYTCVRRTGPRMALNADSEFDTLMQRFIVHATQHK